MTSARRTRSPACRGHGIGAGGHGRGEPCARARLASPRLQRPTRRTRRSASEATHAVRPSRCRPRRAARRSARTRCSSRRRSIRRSRTSSPSSTCVRASIAVVFGEHGSIDRSLSPLRRRTLEWTLARAFDVARASRARVASVGGDDEWDAAFAARGGDGTTASQRRGAPVKAAVHDLAFEPERFDVVVTPEPYAEALARLRSRTARTPRVAASSRLAGTGPGVFAPAHGAAEDIAGQGVAEPRVDAARRCAHAGRGPRRAACGGDADQRGARCERQQRPHARPRSVGVGATTREFADVVISHLPHAMTTPEFFTEAVA